MTIHYIHLGSALGAGHHRAKGGLDPGRGPQMTDPAAPLIHPAPNQPAGSFLATSGGILVVIVALYFGRDIFVPLAIAVLLSFMLAPVIRGLRRLKLPKILAILVAVTLAFATIGVVSVVVGSQLVQLADNLPRYEQNITQKTRSLRSPAGGGGVVERVTTTIEDLSNELATSEEPAGAAVRPGTSDQPRREPTPVIIEQPPARPLDVIRSVLGPLLTQLATVGVVIVFVIFMLIERQDLRDRFLKLAGADDLQRTTEAITEAASRVSRYLLMQLVVNVSYGVPIGVGLYFIGVPNAVLWGVLATVLRFIPYLGPLMAAIFPLALAIAVDPGWSMLVWALALILTVELISNNVVEPWLYGASTGLSSFAIIIAAVFWTMLWGPVGLVLATPLTVCLVVVGRYVPRLEFLGVLLGSDPGLAPEERFYQRLLSGNVEEAVEIAEDFVDEKSSRAFYDEVAIPALRLAQNDGRRSASDMTYRRVVADGAVAVVREVAEHVRETGAVAGADPGEGSDRPESDGNVDRKVLCIGGRTELDRAAAEMLAEALGERGIGVRVLPSIAVSQNAIAQLDLRGIEVACLSYLNPQPQVFARYVCRRLKRRAPNLRIIVCFWNPPADLAPSGDLAAQMGADAAALLLTVAEEQIGTWLEEIAAAAQSTTGDLAISEKAQERLAVLPELGLASTKGDPFDVFARKVADAFDVPIALVSLIGETASRGAAGLPGERDTSGQAPHSTSIRADLASSGAVLVVEDVANDPTFADNPFLLENGVRFYVSAPLRTSSDVILGCLCLMDTNPRTFGARDVKLLTIIADELTNRLEANALRKQPVAIDSIGELTTTMAQEPSRIF
jgi:predicted PurR-regulated permease PerM